MKTLPTKDIRINQ